MKIHISKMDNYSKIVSFNCKSIKRSMEGIRTLCRSADIIALQETWLLPHDLPLLSAVDENFGCTGTSAEDTTAGLVSGRPHGGVALLWRKDAFDTVLPIECNNVRVCAINITVSNRSIVVFSVYMPTNSIENLPVFTTCLSSINSVMETEETKGVEAFYIIGDFNAHPNELFYNEMLVLFGTKLVMCRRKYV